MLTDIQALDESPLDEPQILDDISYVTPPTHRLWVDAPQSTQPDSLMDSHSMEVMMSLDSNNRLVVRRQGAIGRHESPAFPRNVRIVMGDNTPFAEHAFKALETIVAAGNDFSLSESLVLSMPPDGALRLTTFAAPVALREFPALRRLLWSGSLFYLMSPWNWFEHLPFEQLTSIQLACTISINDFVAIVHECKAIETFDVHTVLGDADPVLESVIREGIQVPAKHLNSLTLYCPKNPFKLFRHLNLPSLTRLSLGISRDCVQPRLWQIQWENLDRVTLRGNPSEHTCQSIRQLCTLCLSDAFVVQSSN